MFDPIIEAIPNLGTLAVLAVGTAQVASGATTAAAVVQVAYLFSLLGFPVRALGWVLGELPRSVVGWDRVQSVLDAEGGLTLRRPPARAPTAPAGLRAARRVDYAHVGRVRRVGAGAASRSTWTPSRAARWPWSARPARASRR